MLSLYSLFVTPPPNSGHIYIYIYIHTILSCEFATREVSDSPFRVGLPNWTLAGLVPDFNF